MSYIDKSQHSFSYRFAMQVCDTVLCNNIMHVTSSCYYPGSLGKVWYNPANLTFFCGRWHCDYCFSASASGSAANEIDLPSYAAVKSITQRIGADLSGKVNFKPYINCNHLFVFTDSIYIIYILCRMKLEEGIVIYVIV